MHHAREHADTRIRERRYRVAREAARLIAETGIGDFQQAKRKAAERLGIHDNASLPRNREIEDALREHHRLFQGAFHGDAQSAALRQRREAAQRALAFFAAFDARLAGPVLDGTADGHAPVLLHVHADDDDAVARFLQDQGVPADSRGRRVRLDRERTRDCTAWLFSAEDLMFEVVVLPYAALRQAPLSSLDDKPMRRASAAQLRLMLADEDVAGREGGKR